MYLVQLWLVCFCWLAIVCLGFNSTKELLQYPAKYAWINSTHYHKDGNDQKLYDERTVDPCSSFYVSPLFTNGMILQREPSQAVIFGFGTPNGSVELTLRESNNTSNSQTFHTQISKSSNTLGLGECSWYVVLPAMSATLSDSPRYEIAMNCTQGCENWSSKNESIILSDIEFGDIWVCSGQSNMALGVQHTYSWYNTSINRTTSNYNIQVLKLDNVMSSTPLDSRSYFGHGLVWQQASYENLTKLQFSAVCYYYARHLIDFWRKNDLEVVPIGLVDSSWGGTIIESWLSIGDQNLCDYRYCENYEGQSTYGVYTPGTECNSSKTTDPADNPGSIYNGKTLPLSNMTIKGVLWYQGENNGANPGDWMKNQGYACLLPRLINNWRRVWIENNYANNGNNNNNNNIYYSEISSNNGNPDIFAANTDMPFGVVSLHSWCGEEASNCYDSRDYSELVTKINPTYYNLAWLRWAQVGTFGRLPNWVMPNTFGAMAFDLGDTAQPPPPNPYQGPLHPRNKYTLAKRLAYAALAIAYKNETIAYAGAVLSFCDVNYDTLTINLAFDSELLRGESVIFKHTNGFEVQTNSSFGGWYHVNISSVTSNNDLMLDLSYVLNGNNAMYDKVIGLRYAWRDMPCCNTTGWHPGKNGNALPYCPEASCAVYTKESDLPLVPFTYPLNQKGECILPIQYE